MACIIIGLYEWNQLCTRICERVKRDKNSREFGGCINSVSTATVSEWR